MDASLGRMVAVTFTLLPSTMQSSPSKTMASGFPASKVITAVVAGACVRLYRYIAKLFVVVDVLVVLFVFVVVAVVILETTHRLHLVRGRCFGMITLKRDRCCCYCCCGSHN